MINRQQITRMLDQKAYGHLIERVLGNGRCGSPLLAQLFGGNATCAVAARGLALQRLLELSLGPSADADAVAEDLVAQQEPDGLFGPRDAFIRDRCCASAAALRGLITLEKARDRLSDARSNGVVEREPSDRDIHICITHGLEALAHQLAHGELAADPVAQATLLWQLSGCVAAGDGVDLTALRRSVAGAQGDSPIVRELQRQALASAA